MALFGHSDIGHRIAHLAEKQRRAGQARQMHLRLWGRDVPAISIWQ